MPGWRLGGRGKAAEEAVAPAPPLEEAGGRDEEEDEDDFVSRSDSGGGSFGPEGGASGSFDDVGGTFSGTSDRTPRPMAATTSGEAKAQRTAKALAEDTYLFEKVAPAAPLAASFIQRWWRSVSYRWFLERKNVVLPPLPSAGGKNPDEIPSSGGATALAWHHRLCAAWTRLDEARRAGAEYDSTYRLNAEIGYCQEVGRFAAAAQAGAVMAIHETMLDPFGVGPADGDTGDGADWPRRILSTDSMWDSVRPRFDGDRVYAYDTIIITIVVGNIDGNYHEGGMDHEAAWKMVGHDIKGAQALADAVSMCRCQEPIVPPVAVMVDYLGFRAFCRPQVLLDGGPPAEFVLGPFEEAAIAYGGPQDLPQLIRDPRQSHAGSVGLLLHDWDLTHPELRGDLDRISEQLNIFGYPVALVSDLPSGTSSTALVRCNSAPDSRSQYHFRSPAELAPPEVFPDMWQARPERRLRFEAIRSFDHPMPPTLRGALTRAGTRTTGETYQHLAADASFLQEASLKSRQDLPQQLLGKIGDEGPPLSSQSWTEACHSGGVNMRRLGDAVKLASVHTAATMAREGLARTAKWLLRRALFAQAPWAALAAQPSEDEDLACFASAKQEVVALFNLVLGSGHKAIQYWEEVLVPLTSRRFSLEPEYLSRRKVNPNSLFLAMQHHCRVHFKVGTHYRHFFAGTARPLSEEDLSPFISTYGSRAFPFRGQIMKRWAERLRARASRELPVPEEKARKGLEVRGFAPVIKIACARGSAYCAAPELAAKHVRDGRWDLAYEVKKIELSVTRALGESQEAVANVLQGMTVALLEMAKRQGATTDSLPGPSPRGASPAPFKMVQRHDVEPDERTLRDALQCSVLASGMVPTIAHVWWAQLAAAESSFLLARHTVAQVHMKLLRRTHRRLLTDQPILLLRLEGTFARLYALEGNWAAAAMQTGRCAHLAESLFGKTHPATVALLARFGDCWARQEDWRRSADAYMKALAAAEAGYDVAATARLSYETASVLLKGGDASNAMPFAEQGVRLLLPKFEAEGSIRGVGSLLALECLHLMAKVYEEIVVRVFEEHNCCITTTMQRDLMHRCVRCYETFLRHLSIEPPPPPGKLSRPAAVVESIVRIKAMLMGEGERNTLIDVIEELIMHKSTSELVDTQGYHQGMRAVQPTSDTRGMAEAALRSRTRERPERLEFLYEAVATQTIVGTLDPSDWFDEIVRKMSEGFASAPSAEDPAFQAAISLMDVVRYFGVFAFIKSRNFVQLSVDDQRALERQAKGEKLLYGPGRQELLLETARRNDRRMRDQRTREPAADGGRPFHR